MKAAALFGRDFYPRVKNKQKLNLLVTLDHIVDRAFEHSHTNFAS